MHCVQNKKFGYIYNPFSDGKHRYRNNNEGQTMKSMVQAAKKNPEIEKRIQLFRYPVPEEFYDLEKDPNCLNNLINNPEYKEVIQGMGQKLEAWMDHTKDPMLKAFQNKQDRKMVDQELLKVYGAPKGK